MRLQGFDRPMGVNNPYPLSGFHIHKSISVSLLVPKGSVGSIFVPPSKIFRIRCYPTWSTGYPITLRHVAGPDSILAQDFITLGLGLGFSNTHLFVELRWPKDSPLGFSMLGHMSQPQMGQEKPTFLSHLKALSFVIKIKICLKPIHVNI